MSKVFNVSFLHAKGKNQIRDGLMYRKKKLNKNQGMLFHTGLKVSSFWMKNTFIPLDVLFLNKNGKILGYKENNKPHSLKGISIGKKSFYVLEMNGGWVRENKVKVGDKIKIRKSRTRKKRGGGRKKKTRKKRGGGRKKKTRKMRGGQKKFGNKNELEDLLDEARNAGLKFEIYDNFTNENPAGTIISGENNTMWEYWDFVDAPPSPPPLSDDEDIEYQLYHANYIPEFIFQFNGPFEIQNGPRITFDQFKQGIYKIKLEGEEHFWEFEDPRMNAKGGGKRKKEESSGSSGSKPAKKKTSTPQVDEATKCGICLKGTRCTRCDNAVIHCPACDGIFHRYCLSAWINTVLPEVATCPLCRVVLSEETYTILGVPHPNQANNNNVDITALDVDELYPIVNPTMVTGNQGEPEIQNMLRALLEEDGEVTRFERMGAVRFAITRAEQVAQHLDGNYDATTNRTPFLQALLADWAALGGHSYYEYLQAFTQLDSIGLDPHIQQEELELHTQNSEAIENAATVQDIFNILNETITNYETGPGQGSSDTTIFYRALQDDRATVEDMLEQV